MLLFLWKGRPGLHKMKIQPHFARYTHLAKGFVPEVQWAQFATWANRVGEQETGGGGGGRGKGRGWGQDPSAEHWRDRKIQLSTGGWGAETYLCYGLRTGPGCPCCYCCHQGVVYLPWTSCCSYSSNAKSLHLAATARTPPWGLILLPRGTL